MKTKKLNKKADKILEVLSDSLDELYTSKLLGKKTVINGMVNIKDEKEPVLEIMLSIPLGKK